MLSPFRTSRALRVLWRQDMSAFVPRALPAGLVQGRYLLRYPSAAAPSSSPSSSGRGVDRLPEARATAETPLPSTSWRAKYVCENPSEGTSLAAFTPCCAADVDAILQRAMGTATATHVGGGSSKEGKSAIIPRAAALALLTMLKEVLEEHQGLLAGAEALQTGVPVAHVEAALAAAECYLAETIALWRTEAPAARTGTRGDTCEAGQPKHHPVQTALCVTPTVFSLAHGIRAIAAALHREAYAHVVWAPSSDAALSAMWFMAKLREWRRRASLGEESEEGNAVDGHGDADSPLEALSIVLTGDRESHLLPACHGSLTRLQRQEGRDSEEARLAMILHGLTPSAAKLLIGKSRALARGEASGTGRVDVFPMELSVPHVCVVDPSPAAPRPAIPKASDLGEWILTHSLTHSPSTNANHDPLGGQRSPLIFLPGPQTVVGVLRYLAQHGLGSNGGGVGGSGSDRASMRLGHSLDPTRNAGPLSSAAHLSLAQEVVQAATQTPISVHLRPPPSQQQRRKEKGSPSPRVSWRQVCGGFTFPLTASKAGGYLYVPAILYADLDSLTDELLEGTGSETNEEEARRRDRTAEVAADAARAICLSVQHAIEPLEERFDGTTGVCVFVCGYTGSAERVSGGVKQFLTETAKCGCPWGVCRPQAPLR